MEEFHIPKYLTDHGIKASFQRIKIFEYFLNHKNHPTVNDIYNEVIKIIPTLSKTTVYNTLNLFVEHKILDLIIIEENETRYDWSNTTHGHFKCENCKKVYDIEIEPHLLKKQIPSLDQFQINEHHIYFKGICPNCKK